MYFLAVRTKRTLFLFYIRNKLLSRRKDGRRGRKSRPIGVLFSPKNGLPGGQMAIDRGEKLC